MTSTSTKFDTWVKQNAGKWEARLTELNKIPEFNFERVIKEFLFLVESAKDELPKALQEELGRFISPLVGKVDINHDVLGVALIFAGNAQFEAIDLNDLEMPAPDGSKLDLFWLTNHIFEFLDFSDECFKYHYIASITQPHGQSDVCIISSVRQTGRKELEFIIRQEIDKGACLDSVKQESIGVIEKMKSHNIITKEITIVD